MSQFWDERTHVQSRLQELKILLNVFFVYLITCLRSRSCIPHFVHLKQSFVHVSTLTCNSSCTYYKEKKHFRVEHKLKVYSTHHQPRTQSGYPDYFLQRKKQQTGLLSTHTQTTTQLLSTVFESNEHGRSFQVFVGLRQRCCY